MSWLVVQGGDRRVGARAGALVVERAGEPVQVVRPHEVEEVHLHGDVELSAAARRLLLDEGVDVLFFTRDGRLRGRLLTTGSRAGLRRLHQLACILDRERRLAIARALVEAKVRNQYVVLARAQRRVRDERLADALATLRLAARRAAAAPDLDRLRGLEGQAARVYFGVFGLLLTNPLFRFEGRNRRPPRDPVNAALSFLYTLLMQRAEHAARGAGLEPYAGFLHDAGRGAAALAFDLAEPLRPVVDALVVALVNRRQLAPEDFVDPGVDVATLSEPPGEEDEGQPPADPASAVVATRIRG